MNKPTLPDLKSALANRDINLSSEKKAWLVDNAPHDFNHVQRLVLAYIQAKLANNPQCNPVNVLRSRLRVSEHDYTVVRNHINGE